MKLKTRSLVRLALIASATSIISHCSPQIKDLEYPSEPIASESVEKPALVEAEAEREIESVSLITSRDENLFKLEPWVDEPEVKKWIHYYEGAGKAGLVRYIKRGEKYRPMIEAILLDKGLPLDIYYLALIESGFVNSARSRASAVGMWQFMKGTGKRYGLRVNSYVDERRDPIRSTVAAANYISDLHRVFQSWFLAFAAYSSGEGRVLNAVMNKGTRNYWKLIRAKGLPPETRDYVPKLLAAAWVARSIEGKELNGDQIYIPSLQGVKVASGVKLNDIADIGGISLQSIKKHNPHLLRGVIPPGSGTYTLWLPKELVSSPLELRIVRLKSQGFDGDGVPDGAYRVRSGDSLYSIAKAHNTSVKTLMELNQMRNSRLIAGRLIYLPVKQSQNKIAVQSDINRYKVQKGDTLHGIARKHKTSVKSIKNINKLAQNKIFPGQMIKIP